MPDLNSICQELQVDELEHIGYGATSSVCRGIGNVGTYRDSAVKIFKQAVLQNYYYIVIDQEITFLKLLKENGIKNIVKIKGNGQRWIAVTPILIRY